MATVSINVSVAASRKGLKSSLTLEARRRGYTLSRVVADILKYSIRHRSLFDDPLDKPMEPGGNHISTTVTASVRDELNQWAQERGSRRSNLVAFILEKSLEDNLIERIYSKKDDEDESSF